MTNTLVFIEACTICGRVQRVYFARRSPRKTPLVCADCSEEAKKRVRQPSAPAKVSRGRRS